MEEENDTFINVIIFVFFAIIFYLAGEYFKWGFYTIKVSITWIFSVAFCMITGQTLMWISRYFMPHFTANGVSGSILGRPIRIRDKDGMEWAVFNLGECLEPFHFKGKISTAVCPWSQLNRAGRNYIAKTFMRRVLPGSIPSVVYNFLQHNKDDFNVKIIYYGKFDEEFLHKNPEISDYEDKIASLNTRINLDKDIIEGRNDVLVEMKKFADEMSGNGFSWTSIFKRKERQDETP